MIRVLGYSVLVIFSSLLITKDNQNLSFQATMEQISSDLYDALEGQKANDEALNKVRSSYDTQAYLLLSFPFKLWRYIILSSPG